MKLVQTHLQDIESNLNARLLHVAESGDRRLYFAILEDVVHIVINDPKLPHDRASQRGSDIMWLCDLSTFGEGRYISFRDVCDMFNLDPGAARDAILKLAAAQETKRQSGDNQTFQKNRLRPPAKGSKHPPL